MRLNYKKENPYDRKESLTADEWELAVAIGMETHHTPAQMRKWIEQCERNKALFGRLFI